MVQEHTLTWYRWAYVLKFPVTAMFGLTATLASLYLMQYLIDTGEKALDEAPNIRIVEFIRMKEVAEVRTKERKAKPPPAPDEPPPEIKQQSDVIDVSDSMFTSAFKAPLAEMDLGQRASFSSDGEYLPILKVQPMYPRLALQKGWFGWVLLEFTVDELGRVVDPVVIENCVETYFPGRMVCEDQPGKVFDRPAIAAAEKFKYKPRVVDGVPIATVGVIHKLTFELDEMQQEM